MRFLVILVVSVCINTTYAAGNRQAGKEKAATCAACHGVDGNSAAPEWPKLAGQHAGYIVKQLLAFRSGEREDASMNALAEGLSDEDIADLARYYASLKVTIGTTSHEWVALGEALYRGGNAESGVPACMACHAPNGAGNPAAGYPSLRGQHAAYTAKQLRDYQTPERTTDGTAIMRTIAARLSDAEVNAVASYISGLH